MKPDIGLRRIIPPPTMYGRHRTDWQTPWAGFISIEVSNEATTFGLAFCLNNKSETLVKERERSVQKMYSIRNFAKETFIQSTKITRK